MKKLFLIFHGRFPSEKAAALFAAKSCEAFAEAGYAVTLLVPRRLGRSKENAFAFYRMKDNFQIRFLPTLDLFWLSGLDAFAFHLSLIAFSISSFFFLLFRSENADIVYSNEALPSLCISLIRPRTYFECHDLPRNKTGFYRRLVQSVKGIVVTNSWKRAQLIERFGAQEDKLFREINAVDLKEFATTLSRQDARAKLGLDPKRRIAFYGGHLYSWKGVDTLAEASALLPEDADIFFVGGTEQDIASFKQKFAHRPNVIVSGHRPRQEMPVWQAAADVLVLPNTAKEDISKYDTSPMKLFEYMASTRPIVATDLPSIREIVDETCATFVTPDEPHAMAAGIVRVLNDPTLAERTSLAARRRVENHTWRKRAARIVQFLET